MYMHNRVLRSIEHSGTYGCLTATFFCYDPERGTEVCVLGGNTNRSVTLLPKFTLVFWRDISGNHHCSVSFGQSVIYAASKSEMLDILENMTLDTRLAIGTTYPLYQRPRGAVPLPYNHLCKSNMFFRRYIHCERS